MAAEGSLSRPRQSSRRPPAQPLQLGRHRHLLVARHALHEQPDAAAAPRGVSSRPDARAAGVICALELMRGGRPGGRTAGGCSGTGRSRSASGSAPRLRPIGVVRPVMDVMAPRSRVRRYRRTAVKRPRRSRHAPGAARPSAGTAIPARQRRGSPTVHPPVRCGDRLPGRLPRPPNVIDDCTIELR